MHYFTSFLLFFCISLCSQLKLSTASSSKVSTAPTPSPLTHQSNLPDRALLAFEKVTSGSLVAELNVTVSYTVRNVGRHIATNVALRDSSFPASRFQSDTPARHVWPSLQPGEQVTYSVNVQPRRAGQLYVTPPYVKYIDESDGLTKTTRFTSDEDDVVFVEDLVEFKRRTDTHHTTWLLYTICFVFLAIGPFVVSDGIVKSLVNVSSQQQKKNT